MITIISPKLSKRPQPRIPRQTSIGMEYYGFWEDYKSESWFCRTKLANYVVIPASATHIWVEVSSKQWKNRSGIKAQIFDYRCTIDDEEEDMTPMVVRTLQINELSIPGQQTTVYFRVLYV